MPSLNPFGGRYTATLFEIRLESDVIVLRGSENEASSQMLRGVIVLCLPTPLKIEDVHLRLTGQRKIGWTDSKAHANSLRVPARVEHVSEILDHKWKPFVGGRGQSVTLSTTNHEWPFELLIPGSTTESVEGIGDAHIIYSLKATVARGRLAYDLHSYKPVRIIRTLDPAALELTHAMTVENLWPNKIEYSLIIPRKAIIFGTAIDIEMKLTSLLKGLKIGLIECQLVEVQEFMVTRASCGELRHKQMREIGKWQFEVTEDHYQVMMTDSGQDGFVLKELLPLPKSLKECLQDVETRGIKIRHKVKFNIALHNPDGHTSELRASLPVTIFISPNMPLDESGNLLDQTPNNIQSVDINAHAPPLYGEHILDQLYADIDQTSIRTPATQSGMSTPFSHHSRTGSVENLASVTENALRPDALSNRLQILNVGRRSSSSPGNANSSSSGRQTPLEDRQNSPLRTGTRIFDTDRSSNPRDTALSRRPSEEDSPGNVGSRVASGQHTPEHVNSSDLDLTKVPSYTTAVRMPMRGLNYSDARALPNYEMAVSAPPSPVRGTAQIATLDINRERSNSDLRLAQSNGNIPRYVYRSQDSDAERRLYLLQARGRASA